jgi:exonuclease VII small subunit
MTTTKKESIGQSLKKLEDVLAWFDGQTEVDVEEGLKRVRQGAQLVAELRERLKDVENEFQTVKATLQEEA